MPEGPLLALTEVVSIAHIARVGERNADAGHGFRGEAKVHLVVQQWASDLEGDEEQEGAERERRENRDAPAGIARSPNAANGVPDRAGCAIDTP